MKWTMLVFFLYKTVECGVHFTSVPWQVKSHENDTVLLPCYVQETESKLRVRWYKNETLLGDSHDPHHLLPPRVRMHANYSLQLDNLVQGDTAAYTCEIIRPEPWEPIKQTHTVYVNYSPTVRTVPDDGFLEVKKGDFVDIACDIDGQPKPVVQWRKNGESMPLLEHRSRIRFRAEHRLLAGLYECVADNGVGNPVKASITVNIQDAPEVSASRSVVHTSVGLRAALAARLEFALPAASAGWYRDGRPVKFDDRVVQSIVQDNLHQLIFRNVWKTDFGNYTFRAENRLGMADVTFKLTGIPNVASFKMDANFNKATAVSYTLIWEVDSYSSIIEYNLWIRPYYGHIATEPDAFTTEPAGNHWSKIMVPGDTGDGPIHSARYTVRGLTPSTVYEAIVTSRNRFGWSKPSAVLHFATEPLTGLVKPISFDYTELAPVLEDVESQPSNLTQAQVSERVKQMMTGAGAREIPVAAILVFSIIFSLSY